MGNTIKTRIDKSRESIIWKTSALGWNWGADIICMESAGITFPDKNYAVHRDRANKRFFDNLYVIEYVTSGVGYIESEGKEAKVKAGDLYIIHRKTVHSYYADKKQPFCKKWINISGTYINALAEVFFDDGPFTVLPLGEPAEKILDTIHTLISDKSMDMTQINAKIMGQILELCIIMDNHRKSAQKSLSQYEQIVEYITQNISSDITVSRICDKFFISATTLYRMFVAETGKSPKAYILSIKIEVAKRLIAANDSSMNTIASSLGFYDSHHFFRVFRSIVGVSPTEYKKFILYGEQPRGNVDLNT